MTQTIALPGTTLAYRFDGPADAPVLMLGNSLAADHHMWDENIAALSARYRVLRFDMRGHGSSADPVEDLTPAQLADDAIALLDALGIASVHYLGLSLGGIVGQQLGARYPQRLLSLSLCDTMSQQAAPALWVQRIASVRQEGMATVVDATIERWVTPAFAAANPARIAAIRAMILGTRAAGYAACATGVSTLQQTDLLARIEVPTLVLTGEQDMAAPPAVARAMHEQIRGSQLHIIKDAAHLSNIDQAREFESVVLAFIDAHGR